MEPVKITQHFFHALARMDEREALKAAFHDEENGDDAQFFVEKSHSAHENLPELTAEEKYDIIV